MTKMRAYNTKSQKLTTAQVQEMYNRLQSGELTQGAAARIYGLSVIQVGRIARGESRGHETGAHERPVPNFNIELRDVDAEASLAALRAKLAADREAEAPATEKPTTSWYDQPPPYEEHEMLPETAAKLGVTIEKVNNSAESRVTRGLDELEHFTQNDKGD